MDINQRERIRYLPKKATVQFVKRGIKPAFLPCFLFITRLPPDYQRNLSSISGCDPPEDTLNPSRNSKRIQEDSQPQFPRGPAGLLQILRSYFHSSDHEC